MPSYRYLIVGGGMTGDAACRGIRDEDSHGTIGLVGAEQHEPYARPPLSKALWKGKDESSIWRGTPQFGVDLHLGREIVALDLAARRATDDAGETYEYERLLLATGGTPRRIPGVPDDVVFYRTFDDYRRLRRLAGEGVPVVVIGGGFIGSEVAAALAMNGCKVTLVFPEQGIGARVFPPELSRFVKEYYEEKGVEVLAGDSVSGIVSDDGRLVVATESGRTVEAAAVVAGLGIVPRTDLAEAAGLESDDGILVDLYGRAGGREDVYAAGDVARFPVHALGGTRRVEHEDHANSHGRHVGANMAGADRPYEHLPFFYSDLFELGYEAVGDVDSRRETIAEWAEPNRKGVVAYVDDDGKPVGFLLWDVWDRVEPARELIRAAQPVDAATLRGLLG
jgi:NADPH-dependent 2,4-dienoyl-CoA reductase/sulfur reductase-like enzyme